MAMNLVTMDSFLCYATQTKAADLGNHTSFCSLVYSFRFYNSNNSYVCSQIQALTWFRISLWSNAIFSIGCHLPLDNYTEYSALNDAVSITASVALLNHELFGRTPSQFQNMQYNFSLRFLGPLTILMVLVSLTFLASRHPNCCCRWLSCIKKSVCLRIPKFSLLCYQVNAIT